MKTLDPVVALRIAQGEHTDTLEADELIVSFDNGSTYYWTHDLVTRRLIVVPKVHAVLNRNDYSVTIN
jgi:hypothetical protein